MVLGNGLLAGAFESYRDDQNILIYAAGVSNSGNTNVDEFERELNLIKSSNHFLGTFVYFSTCSIYDPSQKDSLYIRHKLKVENLIQKIYKNYLIVRLPNVVGATKNPYTLLNYFHNAILNDEELSIKASATRYLIHIDDVFKCVDVVLKENRFKSKITNLIIGEHHSVVSIVNALELYLGKLARVKFVNSGLSYEVPCDDLYAEYIANNSKNMTLDLAELIVKTFGSAGQTI